MVAQYYLLMEPNLPILYCMYTHIHIHTRTQSFGLEIGSPYISQTGLECKVSLPQALACRDYGRMPSLLILMQVLKNDN